MLPNLKIGNLTAKYPIIQGGMGVGISLSSLAGAVAKSGGIGVISAAQPGWRDPEFARDPLSANLRALAFHIRRAKEISNGGIIGVNIMCALTHYEEYVRCCIENGADLIISGAGLPTDLPKYTKGSSIKLAPIVSPPRTAKVLLKLWDNHYHRVPDLVVIEGPAAGGHLGYSAETVEETARRGYDDEIRYMSTKKNMPVPSPSSLPEASTPMRISFTICRLAAQASRWLPVSLSRKNAMPIPATNRHT